MRLWKDNTGKTCGERPRYLLIPWPFLRHVFCTTLIRIYNTGMYKYWKLYKTSLQGEMAYRTMIVVFMLGGMMGVLVAALLWLIVELGADGLIAGLTRQQMITYAWLSYFLSQIIGWYPFGQVLSAIKDGSITNYILKPLNPWLVIFSNESAYHNISILVQVIGMGLLTAILWQFIDFSTLSFSVWLPLIILGSLIIVFTVQASMGLLAFWVVETGPISALFWTGISLLGGEFIPNALLPDALRGINQLFFFRYTYAFPLDVMTGQIDGTEIIFGVGVQFIWVVILLGIFSFLWKLGSREYEAIGR